MKISVVIVNYNGKKYLGQCLDSVLRSTYPDFEVVVVENASTDGSFKWLKSKYGGKGRIKLIKAKTNLFFAGGCNLGAKEATGEWLVFLNPDTVVRKDWLTKLGAQARKNKKQLLQPKILSAKLAGVIDNAGGKYIFPGFGVGVGRGEVDKGQFDKIVTTDFANGTCLMINKKFFEKVGRFDEYFRFFYEDVDLNLRAKKMGGKAVVVGSSVIEHLGGVSFKENVASDEVVYYVRRNRLLTVLKNYVGVEKWVRLVSIFVSYFLLPRGRVSGKAIHSVFAYWFIGRLRELVSNLKNSSFQYFLYWILFLYRSRRELLRVVRNSRSVVRISVWELVKILVGLGGRVKLRVNSVKAEVLARNISDLTVLFEIFLHNIYLMKASLEKRRVIDVGGYVGYFTLYCLMWWPNAEIDCYEPDIDNYRFAQRNMMMNSVLTKKVKIHNYGLSEINRVATFYRYHFSSHNSLFKFYKPMQKTRVELRSMKELLVSSNKTVDLAKIDVEGAEFEILYVLAEREFGLIKRLIVEVHQIDEEIKNLRSLKEFLEKYYKQVKQAGNMLYVGKNIVRGEQI